MRAKLLVLMFVTVLAAVTLTADSGDAIPADGGDIQVTPIMRTGVQIEYGGKVIQVNPLSKYDGKEIEYVGKFDALKPADLILVSDVGADNFDVDEIVKIRKPGAPVVMPAAVAAQAGSKIAEPHDNDGQWRYGHRRGDQHPGIAYVQRAARSETRRGVPSEGPRQWIHSYVRRKAPVFYGRYGVHP